MNRKFRLLTGLGIAMLLCVAMVYTALASSTVQRPVVRVGELSSPQRLHAAQSHTVELVGVAQGPVHGTLGSHITFWATDSSGARRVRISYSGSVPDAFLTELSGPCENLLTIVLLPQRPLF